MSTENDPTAPVPTTGPEAPTAPVRRSTTGGPAAGVTGDQPTTPVPRTPARHTDDPTLTLRTAGETTRDEAAPAGDARRAGDAHPTQDTPTAPDARTAPDTRPADAGPARSAEPLATRADTTGDVGARTGRPPVRVGTVVWGLVLAVIGAGIIAVAAGAVIDVQLALITLLALAGLGLVVGSVATGVRRRH